MPVGAGGVYLEPQGLHVVGTGHEGGVDAGPAAEALRRRRVEEQVLLRPQTVPVAGAQGAAGHPTWTEEEEERIGPTRRERKSSVMSEGRFQCPLIMSRCGLQDNVDIQRPSAVT